MMAARRFASSQRDFFQNSDSDSNLKKKKKTRTSSTYDSSKKGYVYTYDFIILFNWNVDLVCPFSQHAVSLFNDNEIKPEWLSKNLGVTSRVSKLRNLSPFPGQVVSLFAKIELGMFFIIFFFFDNIQ